ncbi:hypothetical protein FQN49_003645 [Arthroderma sp. PD_2]|nr:hypothetical protein FQN49_003645 [Arthroderma sp. PD_2]
MAVMQTPPESLRLHRHHKREIDDSARVAVVACACVFFLISVALFFYRARKRYEATAPARLHPDIQLQRQNIPQQPGVPHLAPSSYPPYQTMPPPQVGLRDNDDHFDQPAPPYHAQKQDQIPLPGADFQRTQTPPPSYHPPTQPDPAAQQNSTRQ